MDVEAGAASEKRVDVGGFAEELEGRRGEEVGVVGVELGEETLKMVQARCKGDVEVDAVVEVRLGRACRGRQVKVGRGDGELVEALLGRGAGDGEIRRAVGLEVVLELLTLEETDEVIELVETEGSRVARSKATAPCCFKATALNQCIRPVTEGTPMPLARNWKVGPWSSDVYSATGSHMSTLARGRDDVRVAYSRRARHSHEDGPNRSGATCGVVGIRKTCQSIGRSLLRRSPAAVRIGRQRPSPRNRTPKRCRPRRTRVER